MRTSHQAVKAIYALTPTATKSASDSILLWMVTACISRTSPSKNLLFAYCTCRYWRHRPSPDRRRFRSGHPDLIRMIVRLAAAVPAITSGILGTTTAPSPYRFANEPAAGDPVVTCAGSCGVFRCPIRLLLLATDGGRPTRTGGSSHWPVRSAPRGVACQPRSLLPALWRLETGIQAIQLSPCTPLLCALHRAAAPDFETFPGMLWSRSPFGVSVVSDTGKPGK